MVGIIRQLYLLGLILSSAISVILCQYSLDNIFHWLNGGCVYALQLMPEAKLLTEKDSADHQAFAGNYFSLSVGLGMTMVAGLLYGLLCSARPGGSLQGLKCLVILSFMVLTISSFLSNYMHMSTDGEVNIDQQSIGDKFAKLEPVTPSIGLAVGILAYSTFLSQPACVPELLMSSHQPDDEASPYRQYFKLPLILANISGVALKCLFATSGALMFTDSSNIFEGLLFSQDSAQGVVVFMAVYGLMIVLPQAIDL